MALSAAISGGLGFISNLFGNNANRKAQESANRTNIKLAQMGNEFNERMMDKQMAYNTEMWNRNNAYNDPSAQVARLRAAGLNPSLMMGQGGNSGSAAGGISPASANIARVDPARVDYSGAAGAVQHAVDSYYTRRLQDENVNTLKVRQIIDYAKGMQEIAESKERTNNWKVKNQLDNVELEFSRSMHQMNYDFLKTRQRNMEEDTRAKIINRAIQSKELATYDANFQLKVAGSLADITETYARIRNLDSSSHLNRKQAEQIDKHIKGELAQDILAIAQADKYKIDTKTAERMADHLVEKARIDAFPDKPITFLQEGVRLDSKYDLNKSHGDTLYLRRRR